MKKKVFLLLCAAMLVTGCGTDNAADATVENSSTAASTTPIEEMINSEESLEESIGESLAEDIESSAESLENSGEEEGTGQSEELSGETALDVPYYYSWEQESSYICKQHNFDELYLISDTLKDEGEYYSQEAYIAEAVTVPVDMEIGTTAVVERNTVTGGKQSITLKKISDNGYEDEEGVEYYSFQPKDGASDVALYIDSDDLVTNITGRIAVRIRKDAQWGIAILNEYRAVTAEDLQNEEGYCYYNNVIVDEEGYIAGLVHNGD